MCHITSHLPCKCNSNPEYVVSMKPPEADMMITNPLIQKDITVTLTTLHEEKNDPRTMQTHHHVLKELISICKIAFPMILTGLLLYCRSMISMLFLGRLGELALAGGSLAVGFANISGYPLRPRRRNGIHLRTSLRCQKVLPPRPLLTKNHSLAPLHLYPNLSPLALHEAYPSIIIYLRSQSITLPLTLCATFSILLHIPINYLLVSHLNWGIKGVALSGVWTNLNLVASLILYIVFSGTHKKTWGGFSFECFTQWKSLLNLAIPSCISVCLEWWWYEIMILLCGLLVNPRATVASMGILIQTTSLLYIFPSSISFSVSTRVGNKLGAQKPSKAKFSSIVGLSCSFMLGVFALVFTILVRNIWANMFTQDKEIITLTSFVLPVIGLCELGNCPQTTGCGVLRGTARPKVGANINLGCFYLVGMPVAVWLGFFAGFDFQGLWLGLLAAQGSCAVTMLVVLSRTDWDAEALRAKKLTSVVVDDSKEVGAEKPPKAEIKEDSLLSLADSDEDKQSWVSTFW
ncbi:Multidrug and toxin extrusion protein 1 [Glycine soja]|nr:Multidrug and toxin extrusion protein 1 [Glycine soja]